MGPARWLRILPLRFRSLFRRTQVERELDDELRDHLERQIEAHLASGMSPEKARTAALAAFGGIEYHKEAARDARGLRLLEDTARDLAHAIRMTRRQPGLALIVVLSLALGLGAATAVFHLTWNVLFAPLPLPRPAQLVSLARVGKDGSDRRFSWGEYRALEQAAGPGVLATMRTASQIAIAAGEVREYVNMHFVDGDFFPLTGLTPLSGRLITPNDDATRAPVAVISESLAGLLFPAGAPVVGRTIEVRGIPFTVIGVTPRLFRGLEFPGQFSAAVPLGAVPLIGRAGIRLDDRGQPFGAEDDRRGDRRAFSIVGRLSGDGKRARAALALAFDRCCSVLPGGGLQRLEVTDIRRGIAGGKDDFRDQVGGVLVVLLAGMGVVLVVVCCNIAGLLLVRTSARQREIAVRLSLGASRARLMRQLVLENLPLALLGGLLGLVVASWMTAGVVSGIPEWDGYVDLLRFRSGSAVLLFTGAVTIGCGIACAVFPALRATRQQLGQALRLDVRASRSRSHGVVARGVVVAQIGATVVLVTAASLFAVTLRNLGRVDGGFATERVLLASLETRGTGYEQSGVLPLHEEILRRVREAPGIREAGMATMMPMFGGSIGWVGFEPPGGSAAPDQRPAARENAVAPGFFAAAGIRLLSGRDIAPADGPSAEPVVIVSQALVQRYLGGRSPVGRSLGLALSDSGVVMARIIGVVANAKYSSLRSEPEPILYLALAQTTEQWSGIQLVLRTSGEPGLALAGLRSAVEAAAPGIRLRRVSDMVTQRDRSSALERLAAQLATFVSVM
ncbi:MAG TPA: ABC transporter permease, partial [Gemmatimonadales bacterium]|nr:ABC transporter permease [Gemmatimonadales bacterium]